MSDIRQNRPDPHDLQARRIRVNHGLNPTLAAILASLAFGGSRS